MGKIFGILLIVVGVWVGITVFTEGTDRAFGGLFASGAADSAPEAGEPLTARVKSSVTDAYAEQEARSAKGMQDD